MPNRSSRHRQQDRLRSRLISSNAAEQTAAPADAVPGLDEPRPSNDPKKPTRPNVVLLSFEKDRKRVT